MRICLVTAVDLEFNIAAGLLREKKFKVEKSIKLCRGLAASNQVTVLQSQMGARGFASLLAEHLSNHHYDFLLIAGLAGALAHELKAGDAVVYDRCTAPSRLIEKPSPREENASILCDPRFSMFVVEAVRNAGLSCVLGAGITVANIITDAERKAELGKTYQSIAVDMETFEILNVCRDLNLAATALRVISDEATIDLPDFNRARRQNGEMDGLRLAQSMAARPLNSLQFLLGLRRATKALKLDLAAVLNANWYDH